VYADRFGRNVSNCVQAFSLPCYAILYICNHS